VLWILELVVSLSVPLQSQPQLLSSMVMSDGVARNVVAKIDRNEPVLYIIDRVRV